MSNWLNIEKLSENISSFSVTLFVFHLDKSGKDDNDEQLENIPIILLTFFVFHLDISGKEDSEEHL